MCVRLELNTSNIPSSIDIFTIFKILHFTTKQKQFRCRMISQDTAENTEKKRSMTIRLVSKTIANPPKGEGRQKWLFFCVCEMQNSGRAGNKSCTIN